MAVSYPLGLTAGDVLRIERTRRKISLRRAARDSGVSPSYLSEIERNRAVASEDALTRLATLLGLDAWELCLRDGRMPEAVTLWCKTRPTEAAQRLRTMTKETT